MKNREMVLGCDHPDLAKLLSQLAQAVGDKGIAWKVLEVIIGDLFVRRGW